MGAYLSAPVTEKVLADIMEAPCPYMYYTLSDMLDAFPDQQNQFSRPQGTMSACLISRHALAGL